MSSGLKTTASAGVTCRSSAATLNPVTEMSGTDTVHAGDAPAPAVPGEAGALSSDTPPVARGAGAPPAATVASSPDAGELAAASGAPPADGALAAAAAAEAF